MSEIIQPPSDPRAEVENAVENTKNELAALSDDEAKQFDYFKGHFSGLERNFWGKIDTGNEDQNQQIAEKQGKMRNWLSEAYAFQEMPIGIYRTRYDDRKHIIMQPGGLVFSKDHAEGYIAEVLSRGLEFKGKTVKKAIVRIYVHLR